MTLSPAATSPRSYPNQYNPAIRKPTISILTNPLSNPSLTLMAELPQLLIHSPIFHYSSGTALPPNNPPPTINPTYRLVHPDSIQSCRYKHTWFHLYQLELIDWEESKKKKKNLNIAAPVSFLFICIPCFCLVYNIKSPSR